MQALLIAAVAITAGCETAPPVQEMSDARQAVVAARQAEAATYAPGALEQAEAYLANAQEKLNDQKFSRARKAAIKSRTMALEALRLSEEAKQKKPL